MTTDSRIRTIRWFTNDGEYKFSYKLALQHSDYIDSAAVAVSKIKTLFAGRDYDVSTSVGRSAIARIVVNTADRYVFWKTDCLFTPRVRNIGASL